MLPLWLAHQEPLRRRRDARWNHFKHLMCILFLSCHITSPGGTHTFAPKPIPLASPKTSLLHPQEDLQVRANSLDEKHKRSEAPLALLSPKQCRKQCDKRQGQKGFCGEIQGATKPQQKHTYTPWREAAPEHSAALQGHVCRERGPPASHLAESGSES